MLSVIVRDALETASAISSPWEATWFWRESFFQSATSFRLGGWFKQIVELPILAPELTQARASGFQFPRPAFQDQGPAFQAGLKNALFLSLPFTLSHVLAFRRYALQGLPAGWSATFGYRIGEVLALQRAAIGGARWWQTLEPLPLIGGIGLTAWVVWDATRGRREASLGSQSFLDPTILRITALHFAYAWVEQGVLRGNLSSQTLDARSFSARLYVGPGAWLSSRSYGAGLLVGGLVRDALFLSLGLAARERVLFRLRYPPERWRGTVDRWSTRLIAGLALATLPFYAADYLARGPLGFVSRDTDVSRALSRLAFSVPRPRPNEPVSIQFEGRTVLNTDPYGRSSPDVVRDPWHRAQLSVEATRDGIEETYATRTSNQRVDAVYLGSLERAVFEWLNRRSGQENTRSREAVPVAPPVRLGLGREVAPPATVIGESDRRASRLERWYRAARSRRADTYAVTLPLERSQGHPEGLTALYHTGLESPRYLAGGGLVESYRAVRYDAPPELSRKRNARRSPLHRGPVHAYRDWLLARQPNLSTVAQQRGLYRARLALGDYLAACRRYQEAERGPRGWDVTRRVSLRGIWQRELEARTLGSVRSRASTVYSQQYTGNLHLARRLFAVSWDPRENRLALSSNSTAIGSRRKLALDQLTLQRQATRFEHEDVGRSRPTKVQNAKNRRLAAAAVPQALKGQWVLLPGGVVRPDRNIHPQPLYAGWDPDQRALVLCNRYLPPERARKAGPEGLPAFSKVRTLSDEARTARIRNNEPNRANFSVWPRNSRTRRRRTVNTRYTSRALLSRRRAIRDSAVLQRDRSRWAQAAVGTPSLAQFAFWLNPRSDARRSPQEITPTRSSQAFPLAFERSARVGVYVPGDLQPSSRGGLLWPGGDRRDLGTGWRPGAPVLG